MTTAVDPLTPDVLAANLAAAESALTTLMTIGGVVEVSHNGKIMRYARANAPALQAYIRDLRGKLGLPGARAHARRIAF